MGPLIHLTIVNNQSQGSRSRFSNQVTRAAVMGVVFLLIFLYEASINTFLYLALKFINLFLRSAVETMSHWRFLKLTFQFQVQLDQSFA